MNKGLIYREGTYLGEIDAENNNEVHLAKYMLKQINEAHLLGSHEKSAAQIYELYDDMHLAPRRRRELAPIVGNALKLISEKGPIGSELNMFVDKHAERMVTIAGNDTGVLNNRHELL